MKLFSDPNFTITALLVFSVLCFILSKVLSRKKPKTATLEAPCAPLLPYIYRGKNLDKIKEHFPGKDGEEDWEYVKRIFPEMCVENPEGAVTLLIGKSVTEMDSTYKWLAQTFLAKFYNSKTQKRSREISNFLRGFGSDPALNG
jgi:hypothetical protein